jgi:hypothetical protein
MVLGPWEIVALGWFDDGSYCEMRDRRKWKKTRMGERPLRMRL